MSWPRRALLLLFLGCARPVAPPDGAALAPEDPCQALLADSELPATPEAATLLKAAGYAWPNDHIRAIYVCRAAAIADLNQQWIAQGLDAETRARGAYNLRKQARLTARAMMADPAEVAALEARDLEKYGHKDGPSWEWLVERARERGLMGDALYESIIESAQVTNEAANRAAGP